MKDDDFKLLRGFDYEQTDGLTDICDCRVAFVTEKAAILQNWSMFLFYTICIDTVMP